MEAQNAVIPQLDPLKRETTDVSAVDQPQNIEEKGTWLLITNPLGSTLGYVRLDDHDHDLNLSEIREMIHMKLATQAEYQHGWGFGTGWPLKIVSRKEEQSVLAKGVLPAITVLSDHSAQLLSQQADVISAATAMQYGINPTSAGNMDGGFSSNVNLNVNFTGFTNGNTAAIQPLPMSSMFAPAAATAQNNVTLITPITQNNNNALQPPMSGESGVSDQSRRSGSSAAPPLPSFSPPQLSQQEIAAKAQVQRIKLQNLLPGKRPISSANAGAIAAGQKRTESPKTKSGASSSRRSAKKPMIPRLKQMDSAGNVIETNASSSKREVKPPPNLLMQRDLYCNQCLKTFETERGYKQHMKKQHNIQLSRGRNKERRFECDYHGCDRAFYQRSDLRRHQRVHLGVKPFKCSVCLKEFTQRGSLYRHIKGSHKGKDHRKLVLLNEQDRTMPTQPKKKRASVSPTQGAESMSDLPPLVNNAVNQNQLDLQSMPSFSGPGTMSLDAVPPMIEQNLNQDGNAGKEEVKSMEGQREETSDDGVPPPLIKMKAVDNDEQETTDNRPPVVASAETEDVEMKEEKS